MKRFRQIFEFPNYKINTEGNIYSKKFNGLLKPRTSNGYKCVCLYRGGKKYDRLIHRLVLETFIGLCPEGMECRHLDGNKKNNKLDNLKWGTRSENAKDAIRHGTSACLRLGNNSINHKLTEQNVRMIIYMWSTGLFIQQEIADMYNMSREQIRKIINRQSWKHIHYL